MRHLLDVTQGVCKRDTLVVGWAHIHMCVCVWVCRGASFCFTRESRSSAKHKYAGEKRPISPSTESEEIDERR